VTILSSVRHTVRLQRLPSWAVIAGVCGLIADVSTLPSVISGPLLTIFICIGPGAAVVDHWSPILTKIAVRGLVPVASFSIVLLCVSLGLLLGFWSPRVTLLGLALGTIGTGALRLRFSTVRGTPQ
jgi:hypothetical protein